MATIERTCFETEEPAENSGTDEELLNQLIPKSPDVLLKMVTESWLRENKWKLLLKE